MYQRYHCCLFSCQIERRKRLSKLFLELGVVQENDTLMMALEAMAVTQSTRAIVSNSEGDVIGVVGIMDICRELLSQEASVKSLHMQQLSKEDRLK